MLNLSYPDQVYSSQNPPSNETLKADLSLIESGHNALETEVSAVTETSIPSIASQISTGWVVADGTWSASDANTISIAGLDLTGVLQKGDKIKLTNNSAVKYFYISTVPAFSTDTTFDVTGEVDLVATAEVTSPYFSKIDNPQGFKKGELFYKARVISSGTQSVPAAAFTVVALNSKSYDLNSNFDTSTYRYTAPIAGFYSIKFQGRLNFSTDTLTDFLLAIYKNGSNYSYGQRRADSTVGAGLQYGLIDDTAYLNKGDYIDFRIYQGSGGNKNTEAGACCNIKFIGV